MKERQKLTLAAMVLLLAGTIVSLYLTRTSKNGPSKTSAASNSEAPAIDQRYLATVLRLAALAKTPEEQQAAKKALDAADHELDLEYAYALQLSAIQPVVETPEIRAIQDRIAKIRAGVQTRQTEVDELKRAVGKIGGARRSALEEQLNIQEAELNLWKEALSDAQDDLIQAGGDAASRLQKLKAEHEAASEAADTFKFPPLPSAEPLGSLLAKWSDWKSIHWDAAQIRQAGQGAYAAAARLSQQRAALEKQVATDEAQRKALVSHELTPQQIAALLNSGGNPPAAQKTKPPASAGAAAPPASTAHVAENAAPSVNPAIVLIQRISAGRSMDRLLAARARAMDSLGAADATWESLSTRDERRMLHGILAGVLWIILLMVLAFALNRAIEHSLARLSLERKQKTTLQSVFRVTVRLAIVLVILILVFGKPKQLSTVLGLAGAGLAIALQDIIMSFLGWFVLMGRHGIRVGDWVEINSNAFTGVRGEVIEITLFRTVLLETGNWNEPGHPTGRQVAFMNMYAVTGYYFNFTTAGQWLWDELQVLIPATQNPYPLVERIQAIVAQETEGHAQAAEREWQNVSRRYGTKSLSAKPSVNLKLTDNGVIAIVRYITRADERTTARYRLNHQIVKLFRDGEELVSSSGAFPATEAPPSR